MELSGSSRFLHSSPLKEQRRCAALLFQIGSTCCFTRSNPISVESEHALSDTTQRPRLPDGLKDRPIEVQLFTDGGCSGNPGPGGWGFILRHKATGKEREGAGGEKDTTNNRMELTAVVMGLAALNRPCHVELITDSTYVGKGLIEWMPRWKANGWQRREKSKFKPVKNVDLWQRLDQLASMHAVTYTAVLGHTGHPENERADRLAVDAYQKYL